MQFEKFTKKNQEAVQQAIELAVELGHQQIDPEHLTYAFLKIEGSLFFLFLERFNVSIPIFLKKLEKSKF